MGTQNPSDPGAAPSVPAASAEPSRRLTADDVARFRANRQAEIDSAALYRAISETERDTRLAAVFRSMAESEAGHATFWERLIAASGRPEASPRPTWRTRALIALARRFGSRVVLPTLLEHERSDSTSYADQVESRDTALPADERSHRRLLGEMAGFSGVEGATIARLEGRVFTNLACSAAALFLIGAGITLLTGRSVWYSGVRQLLFGVVAAGLTYGVGRLLGAQIAG